LVDEPLRVWRRLRVVPELGGSNHSIGGVEHDLAVLLPRDRGESSLHFSAAESGDPARIGRENRE
jgi:hypothetical protein